MSIEKWQPDAVDMELFLMQDEEVSYMKDTLSTFMDAWGLSQRFVKDHQDKTLLLPVQLSSGDVIQVDIRDQIPNILASMAQQAFHEMRKTGHERMGREIVDRAKERWNPKEPR